MPGPVAPWGQHHYLGDFASDAAALTYIQSNKWDSLGTGLGTPQNGMMYYNTTNGLLRRYATPAGESVGAWGDLESQIQYVAQGEPTGWAKYQVSNYAGDFYPSFDDATRKFTLTSRAGVGTNCYYFVAGKRYNFTTSLTSGAITDTEGLWFCYFDSSGAIQVSQTFWDLSQTVPIATVYWDSTNKKGHSLAFEGHGVTMDWKTHLYLHLTVSSRYASGLATGNFTTAGTGNSDTDAQFSVSTGTIFDEDIQIDVKDGAITIPTSEFQQPLSVPAQIPIYYRDGVGGNWRVSTVKQIVTLQAGGYVNCVAGDVGKTVLIGGVASGALLWYDNTNRKWLIDYWTPPPAVPIPNGSALTISGGTGAGTTTGNSISSGTFVSEHGTTVSTGLMKYNLNTAGTWTRPDATQPYVAVWLFATNEIRTPVIAIMGQRQDNTLNSAQNNNTFESISFGSLPFHEIKVIWRLIFQTVSTYQNAVRARLVSMTDYRSVNSVPASNFVPVDHSSLSGRSSANQHPATAVSADTTGFNNLLSAADSDVQLALDTIDDGAINKAGTVAFTGDQSMGTHKLTNVVDPANPQDAATKNYVDSVVSGYRAPVSVLKMVDDTPQIAAPAGVAGDAWVVAGGWGGGYTNGDIVEYSGAAWVTIVAGSLGLPANGTRVVVKSAGSAGSFAAKANQIAQYVTGTGWVFTPPNDGDIVAVKGDPSVYENKQYIYDTSGPGWVDFGSTVSHDSTTGKSGDGPEWYHLSSAQKTGLTGSSNTTLHNHDATYPKIYSGAGSPEGSQSGKLGDIYVDTTDAVVYLKKSGTYGAPTSTGWGEV